MYSPEVVVKQFYVETGEYNSKGKPVLRRVVIRKLLLHKDNTKFGPDTYRVTYGQKRGFTINELVEKDVPWYGELVFAKARNIPEKENWKRVEKFYKITEFVLWLKKRVSGDPIRILDEFLFAEPSNAAA